VRAAVAWLSLAVAAPATASDPLILGMLTRSDGAPVLRLMARIDIDGRWRSADELLDAAMTANRLGGVLYGKKNDAPSVAMDLGAFAGAVFAGDGELREWYGHTPRGQAMQQTAVEAAQMNWSCNRGWGLRLKADTRPTVAGSLLANRPVDVRYFVPEPDKDADTKSWSLASVQQEAQALATYRGESSGRLPAIPDDIDAAALSHLPLQEIETRSATLDTAGRLVSMSARRLLRTDRLSEKQCEQPSLVYTALFHRDAAGRVTRVQDKAEVQDCAEGWTPAPKRQPWLVLYLGGKPYLLQLQFGLESQSTGVYAFDGDGWTPAAEPMLSTAESGC
jgi:hypothetical protein